MDRARNSVHESFPRRAGDRGVGALRRGRRSGGRTAGASAGCDIGRYGAAPAAAERAACDVDRANGAGRVGRVRRRRRGGAGRIRQVARTQAAAIDRVVVEPAGAVFTRSLTPNVAAALRAVRTRQDGWRFGASTRRYALRGLPTLTALTGEWPRPVSRCGVLSACNCCKATGRSQKGVLNDASRGVCGSAGRAVGGR